MRGAGRRRSASARIRVALAMVVVLAACGADQGGARPTPGGPGVTVEAARSAVAALCELVRSASRDLERARALFFDRAHDTLHAIAAAAQPVEAAAAARLLEAKARVEGDLRSLDVPPSLSEHVDELDARTREALAALEIEVPPCE